VCSAAAAAALLCCDFYWYTAYGPALPLQGVWSRALSLPIERPKSLTFDALATRLDAAAAK